MGTILRSRRIVLLATGASKASCVERVVHGNVTTAVPASFLQLHGDVDVMVDEAAGGKIRSQESGVRM
jgi:glucosamine-6-phosphate deaminase